MNRSLNTESLEAFILDHLNAKPQIKRWVVAYSGGLDSSVLLHLIAVANQGLPQPKPVLAVHINHGLSANADCWQQHCEQTANNLGLTFIAKQVVVENQGQGIEAAAREQRYRAFASIMQEGDCLVTGHHEDDQSETFLLRLLRGAGVQGLGAMADARVFAQGQLLRPLLNTTRQSLDEYARDKNLTWVNDESNNDTVFDRNFLRQEVIPLLSTRWKKVKSRLAETAERLQSAQQLLNDLAAIDLEKLSPRKERYGVSIDGLALKKLDRERINNVLRFWCCQQHLPQPNRQQLYEVHRQLLSQQAVSTQAVVAWGMDLHACEMRQFNQRLYMMPALTKFKPPQDAMTCSLNENNLKPFGAGILSLYVAQGNKNSKVLLVKEKIDSAKKIQIRWRKGGERCAPAGRAHSQQLKKLLQEYQLETWLRDRVPLVYIDDDLAAVGDVWVCEEYTASDSQEAVVLEWLLPAWNNSVYSTI